MDKELKAKWVEALRSGEYTQGRTELHRDGEYCCLGVFCVVAGRQIPAIFSQQSPLYVWFRQEMGDAVDRLWRMNDGVDDIDRRYSFPEIADYIEANL